MKTQIRVPMPAALVLAFLPFPAASESAVIALRGGNLFTMTQGVIEGGTVLIQDGKIAAVGKDVPVPVEAEVIDVAGQTVLPGLIDSFTNLGAADVASLGADDDEATSPVMPHLRIIDAINPDNRFFSMARAAGVTAVLCAPGEGNLLSGQSALIRLGGSGVDDMVVRFPVGVHGSLGEAPKARYGGKEQLPMTRMGAAALLRQTLLDALSYAQKIDAHERALAESEKQGKEKPVPPDIDFKLQSLVPVVKGEIPLILGANRFDDILTSLRIAEEFGLKLILNHGAESHRVAERLASKGVPVLLGPLSRSAEKLETQGATGATAAVLHKAGVRIAFQTGSFEEASNLLYQARLAVSQGLPEEDALKALTLYPAQILGVEDRLGSLETGKDADIVVFDGHPLEDISRVTVVIIGGQKVTK